jgi:hypothetical protein
MPPRAENPPALRLLVEPVPVLRRGPLPEELRAVMPVHLFDDRDDLLTRCALFGDGVLDRITDDIAEVTCYHCVQHGPASAYVVLPDGRVVERRSSALDGRDFAVAVNWPGPGGTDYRLVRWATDIADAAETRARYLLRARNAYILPVLHSR